MAPLVQSLGLASLSSSTVLSDDRRTEDGGQAEIDSLFWTHRPACCSVDSLASYPYWTPDYYPEYISDVAREQWNLVNQDRPAIDLGPIPRALAHTRH